MNMKKIITSAIIGASLLLGLAGTGTAGTYTINIQGASAQFLFWSASVPQMLSDIGCTNIKQAAHDSKNSITQASCGSDTLYVAVQSTQSWDGVDSALGIDTDPAGGASSAKCSGSTNNSLGGSRMMTDPTTCNWSSTQAIVFPFTQTEANSYVLGSCSGLVCSPITVGISDVKGESFLQSSNGHVNGPLGGSNVNRSFAGINTSTLTSFYNPIVVPFAFYANASVTRCADGDEWNTSSACTSGAAPAPLSNMSRMMAVQIFSGQALYWTDLGGEFAPNFPIQACFRHAGSGTHATLDWSVMNHSIWGAALQSVEVAGTAGTGGSPSAWFNDSSSSMVNCIEGSGSWSGSGAVGYADADQSTSGLMTRLTYNGEAATRVNIRNGRYDFWTNEWAYENTTNSTGTLHNYVSQLMAKASLPQYIPSTVIPTWGASKSLYWASQAEMTFEKTKDQLYPGYVGATDPQTP